jgi:hypothetical protein
VSLDGFCPLITLLCSANQHLTIWLPVVRLYSGTPEIASFLLQQLIQPYTPEPPEQYGFYTSFVLITDGILLPTVYPLWPLQTSIFSVLEKHSSFCESYQRII